MYNPNDWPSGSQRSKVALTDPKELFEPSMKEVRANGGYGVLDLTKIGVAVPYERIPSHTSPNPFTCNGDFENKGKKC